MSDFINLDRKKIQVSSDRDVLLGLVTFNHPPVNTLSNEMLHEIQGTVKILEGEGIRLIIFTGEGKSFIAGADLNLMKDFSVNDAKEFAELGHLVMDTIEESEMVSIAAINGFALGGGLEFALACDIRIVSEKARLALPEVGLGVIPGFGGTQRLSRLIGEGNAKFLKFTGMNISPDEAFRLGIAQKLVVPEKLLEEAEEIAKQILRNGPEAVRVAKKMVRLSTDVTLKEGLIKEKEAFANLFSGPEAKEGINAFLEKREANFS